MEISTPAERLKSGVIIVKDDSEPKMVLLIFRHVEQDWSFPKGHIENGETADETATRETLEETGLTVAELTELPPHQYVSSHEHYPVYCHMFFTTKYSGSIKPENSGDKVGWFSKDEVTQRLTDLHWRDYYLNIQKNLFSDHDQK
jgi:8-oxo-dGTP diphosphatase